ncbi:diguanylate cyclase [Cohnella nanjingensis]|uniref:Diguanylate cyclase n=1 Tax=Cohnella nanjingensis TaxID=1387779 RepID=A0A7X0RW67_9BACL|nr:diguanylate cyclase [Cohnella nanjingensis]MBB6673591.1 diguanylate cyclase [Cohnella nanjingensis]
MLRYMIANFALLTAFLFLFNQLFRRYLNDGPRSLRLRLLIGALHGGCALLLLLFSFRVNENTVIDFRHIIVICSAYFGGLPASLVTALFVAIGRVAFFGGFTPSATTAIITIALVGIGSGLIMQYVGLYWRRWLLSLLLSLSLITLRSFLEWGISADTSLYLTLIGSGGLFSAALIAFFSTSNRLAQELENSENRYRTLLTLQEAIFQSAVGTAVTVCDSEGRITHFNKAAEKMLGYQADELIGRETPLIFTDPKEVTACAEQLSRMKGKPFSQADVFIYYAMEEPSEGREWSYIRKDGSRLTVLLTVSPLLLDGEAIGFIGTATDITERKKLEETLHQLSLLDGLTEIANRRYFDESLHEEWRRAERSDKPCELSLILFDIDSFKAYNDVYGHLAGDVCLRKVAALAKGIVGRPSDTVARYGGEEFAVILPETNVEGALRIAQKLRAAVESESIPHAGSTVGAVVTISVGVATLQPKESGLPERLIEEADQALYASKANGRNRVTEYRTVAKNHADEYQSS